MVEISDRKDLRAWLDGKNQYIAVLIAARAALRAVPATSEYLYGSPDAHAGALLLPLFRAISLPWLTVQWSNHRTELRAAYAAYANAADAASAADAANSAANAANSAALAAINANAASAPANAAANAATLAADATAAATVANSAWREVAVDVNALDNGLSLQELARRPLWSEGVPEAIGQDWHRIKTGLLALDEDWQVWTDWYDDRLRGANDSASRPLIEALELRRAQIPDEDWEKGAKHVNAIIAGLEAEYRAQAPEQRPAIIEVEYGEDGILHRRESRPPEARDDAQEQRLRDAWAAQAAQLAELETLNPGQNAPALAGTMRLYRQALGAVYEELNVIALGVHGESLQAHAARADDRLLEDAAGALVGMAAAHGLFIRQFDAWRDYVDDATGEPSDEVVEEAVKVAQATRDVIDLIGDDVSDPLNELANAARPVLTADPADRPRPAVQNEFLRSTGNVLSVALAPFVKLAREFGGRAWKGTLDGAEDGFKGFTKNLIGKGGLAIALGTAATGLAAAYPSLFGWLEPVLSLLKRAFGT